MRVSDLCGLDAALAKDDLSSITIHPAELKALPDRPRKQTPAKVILPGTAERMIGRDRRAAARADTMLKPKPGEAAAHLLRFAGELLREGIAERRASLEAEEADPLAQTGLPEIEARRSRAVAIETARHEAAIAEIEMRHAQAVEHAKRQAYANALAHADA